MKRKLLALVLGLGVHATAASASAAGGAQVPSFTLHRLQARFGDMVYLPTRVPAHYRYERWRTVGGRLVVDFKHQTGEDRFSFEVEQVPATQACDLGGAFLRTMQMAGNKIYYRGEGGEWITWRCVTSPKTHAHYLLSVHSRGPLPDVALAMVDSSGKRFAR